MALVDARLILSSAQDVTAANALNNSTNCIDLQSGDFADATDLAIEVVVTTAFAVNAGAPVMQFAPMLSDNTAFVGGNTTILYMTGGTPLLHTATFVAGSGVVASALFTGARFVLPLMHPCASLFGALTFTSNGTPTFLQRYLQLGFVQPLWATDSFSTGAVDARIIHTSANRIIYPDGIG